MSDREDPIVGLLPSGFVIDDRYQVAALIGRGGSGLIFGARDVRTKQGVAIKTLNADMLSHPSAVARYHREARAAASIGHPNICAVLDAGQLTDGRPYLVMELLSGRTLADRIKEDGALPFAQVLTILTQTLSALEAAHDMKIVHRDIKPDNVFLTDRIKGVVAVKLLDFGIAKSLDENAELSLTRTGMVVGTPYYMAPEQARGEQLDHRVDLYACGVILYEMLTGRRPFHATNYNALMMQVLTMEAPDPRHLRPAVPSGFVSVMQKAMAKDRRDRYETARAFLDAIWDLQSHLSDGLGPEEIERIARAVQLPTGRPRLDSEALEPDEVYEDIPIYEDSAPPPGPAPLREQPEESECETRPFIRPDQLVPPNNPVAPSRISDPFVEATEVMRDAPWLKHRPEDDQAPPVPAPPASEPPSWDDEPTRVEPPPFTNKPAGDSKAEPRRPSSRPGRRPPARDTEIDPPRPRPPARVPRPKRKG